MFLFFQISVKYTDKKVKPGEKVSLKISAKSDSSVFLLAVDKSVQLLKDGNDITQDKVSTVDYYQLLYCQLRGLSCRAFASVLKQFWYICPGNHFM